MIATMPEKRGRKEEKESQESGLKKNEGERGGGKIELTSEEGRNPDRLERRLSEQKNVTG